MHMLKNRVLGGVLLVSGTTIGGAVLALPVSTGIAGLVPSTLIFLFFWVYLTYTAFLFLEANLWVEGDKNIISMAGKTLGLKGKAIGWFAYLLLLYALTTAYVAVSGAMCVDLAGYLGLSLPSVYGPIPVLIVFGGFVYWGTQSVDAINRLLMISLGLAFLLLIGMASPGLHLEYWEHQSWSALPKTASVVVTAFGFHIIIPSLTQYLGHEVKPMQKVLLIGSGIPLVIYLLWEAVTLGVIPLAGEYGLIEANAKGVPVTNLLRGLLEGDDWIILGARVFDFCAILTSFLGVSLSLLDFLADGLSVKKTHMGRLGLIALSFAPPLIISYYAQRVFFTALEVAGGIGVAVLLGFLPAAMVWAGRYHHGFKGSFRVPGGKPALIAVMVVSVGLVVNEMLTRFF